MKITYLLLLIACFWSLSGCSQEEAGIHPSFTTITEAVYGTATVVPREVYDVYAPVNGILERSKLREGELVSEGDELFLISNERAALERKKAGQSYVQARERYQGETAILHELQERLQSSKLSMVNDSLNYARQARLWQQKIGSLQAFEAMELKFITSRNQVDELLNAYERTRRELADQVALAKISMDISGQLSAEHTVKSKMNGTVYEVFTEIGEAVNSQSPVARIGSKDDFILEILIDEVDIARVKIGQQVVVVLDAYRQESYDAAISKILPHKDSRSQTFTVEAVFTLPPPQLYDGLSGEANIIISRNTKAITLPTEFIGPGDSVQTADGKKAVVTGIADFRYTEIISGIDTTTLVYKPE